MITWHSLCKKIVNEVASDVSSCPTLFKLCMPVSIVIIQRFDLEVMKRNLFLTLYDIICHVQKFLSLAARTFFLTLAYN